MYRKLITYLCLFTLTSFYAVAGGKGATPQGKPFVTINEQVVEVQDAIASLEDRIDLLVGRVDTLETALTANQKAITSLKNQNASLTQQIQDYGTDIASLQAQIDVLTASNAELQDQIDANSGNVSELQNQIAANEAEINSLAAVIGGVADLESRIADNELMIAMINQTLVTIEDNLTLKQNLITGSCPAGSAFREIMNDGTVICDEGGGDSSSAFIVRNAYATTFIEPFNGYELYLNCPSGFKSVSSGMGSQDIDTIVYNSIPYGDDGWYFYVINANSYTDFISFYVRCVKQQ